MNNYIQPGAVVDLTAPYARLSGEGAKVGSLFGVATGDVASGAEGQFLLRGVVALAKTSAQAWTQGQRIYWDDTNKRADSDGTLGMFIGLATEAAANPSSTGKVLLAGPSSLLEGTQAAEADLVVSVGTSDGTIADVGAAFNQVTLNNNFRAVADKLNAVLAKLRAVGIIT